MNKPKAKRRWYQISLRTLFVGMTLASVVFGWWVHRSREWIRQRHEALRIGSGGVDFANAVDFSEVSSAISKEDAPRAPGGLWLFGEKGISTIWWQGPDGSLDQAQKLFPEAKIRTGSAKWVQ